MSARNWGKGAVAFVLYAVSFGLQSGADDHNSSSASPGLQPWGQAAQIGVYLAGLVAFIAVEAPPELHPDWWQRRPG